MKSKVLEAFLAQTDINGEKADLDEAARAKIHEINMEKAMIHLAKAASTSMSEAINAPTKIDAESLNDTPIPHKNLEKYDHSLEVNRDWQNPTKS